MSKRFELINFLNAHDKFRDKKNNKELDSFDIVSILNHYEEVLKDLENRGAFIDKVKYDYDEDDNGETVEQVIIDGKKYIDIEYFARMKADLESKLAEHNEYFRSFSCENFNEFQDFISTFMLTPHEEQTLIRELKQQLAEKEEQINMLEEHKFYADNIIQAYADKCKNSHQDKISFAVDILEELADCSNYINSKLDFERGSYVSEKAIRDKIKYLEGKKDE